MRIQIMLVSGLCVFFELLLCGCGVSAPSTVSPQPSGPVLPSVAVAPSSATISSSTAFNVNVTVTSGSSLLSGTIILSSGNFATLPAQLANGQTSIAVPAGVLAIGSDTLTAKYTPTGSSSTQFSGASGTAAIAITQNSNPQPQVTTSQSFYPTTGDPFEAIPLSDGQVLVSINGANTGIQVFSPSGAGLVSSCVNSLANNLLSQNATAFGMSLFNAGSNVALTVGDPGVDFFTTSNFTSCQATGTGYFVSQGPLSAKEGAINVAITPDGKYAFVANEYGVAAGATSPGNVGVVALAYDATGNISSGSTLLGQISTGGNSIPGLTLSPDGSRLYVTSEIATSSAPAAAGAGNPILTHGGCLQAAGSTPHNNGLLTVINVAQAEASPSQAAIITTLNSGCSPVRIVESADNNIIYVGSRGDNRILVFSTGMLEQNADNALLGYADSGGTAPIGMQLFHNQQLLAVANSDRFGTGTPPNATVFNVAIPSAPVLVQTIPTYTFPREFSLASDDRTLYLTNYSADQLEVISTTVK